MSTKENFIDFTFSDILSFLLRWRKHLIIIGVVAAVASAAGSYLITPRYEAEVVFYPTTINSIGNAMFTDLNRREADVLAFGEEEEAENALQILMSDKLSSRIIRNFNLMEHYGIDPDGAYPKTKLQEKMKKNISYNRTRYLSISIKVLDEDPKMAAIIANGIGTTYDSVKTAIQREVALETFIIIEEEFKNKEKEVWDLQMGLQRLGSKGILDIEKQAQSITESLYSLQANGGNSSRIAQLKSEKDTLAKYGSEFTKLKETMLLELEELSLLRKRHKKAKVDVEKTIPHKFVVSNASTPEKKALPSRKLIVMLGTSSTLAAACVFLLFVEQRKKIAVA